MLVHELAKPGLTYLLSAGDPQDEDLAHIG